MGTFTPGDLGFTPVWCVGGPLDGRGYSDMPLFPNGMPAERVAIPLDQAGEKKATYLRRPQPAPDGRWQYDFAAAGIPMRPFPTGTQVSPGGHWGPAPAPVEVEPELAPAQLAETARMLAHEAHVDQVDKAGEPYIGHPERVAARFDAERESTLHAAAWLHDVLEDSDMDAEWLRAHGIPDDVLRIVETLTRRPEVSAETYYAAIRLDPEATVVKAADIADNLDPQRLNRLDPVTRARLRLKYDRALRALGLDGTLDFEENA